MTAPPASLRDHRRRLIGEIFAIEAEQLSLRGKRERIDRMYLDELAELDEQLRRRREELADLDEAIHEEGR